MKNKEKIILDVIESIGAIIVWLFFVFLLYERGYRDNYSPILLGIVSLFYSGSIALFNGIFPNLIAEKKEKVFMFLALIMQGIATISIQFVHHIALVIIITLIQGISFSALSEAKKLILIRNNYIFNDEFIFKLFRMVGPMLAGIMAAILSEKTRVLYVSALAVVGSFLIVILNEKGMEKQSEIRRGAAENHHLEMDDIHYNPYTLIGLSCVLTFCIQVVDAQLITVFKNVENLGIEMIGICIGCSGIGVFLISIFFEQKIKSIMVYMSSVICMGIVLLVGGTYLIDANYLSGYLLMCLFFCGGVFWQISMTFLENMIKSVSDEEKRNSLFGVVGICTLITYSLGAAISGLFVLIFGIGKVYLLLGCAILLGTVVTFILNVKWKSKLTRV